MIQYRMLRADVGVVGPIRNILYNDHSTEMAVLEG